ncbi:serine protease snake-like isoform X1 [Athalia rosae]|uniref:serine protease snake-like isoform X1 n=2 Tax=Athalia rosae TaxID=37344 RepID=UPI0020338D14|nr:serine protease snake-like isoform X1 [Athalia rosae]
MNMALVSITNCCIVLMTVSNLVDITISKPDYVVLEENSYPEHGVQYGANDREQLTWYSYDIIMNGNSRPANSFWSSSNRYVEIKPTEQAQENSWGQYAEVKTTEKPSNNPWIVHKWEENKKTTKREQIREVEPTSLISNIGNIPIVPANRNNNENNDSTEFGSYSETRELSRLSETKCEEYGRAVGRKIWALALVGTRPQGVPLSAGNGRCEGLHTPLIVGGTKAQQGEFPHMAALGWFNDNNGIQYFCGGTLISEHWVVTAAHCTHGRLGSPSVVRLGSHDLADKALGEVIEIKRIIKHNSYKPPALYADIALLELKKDVKFTDNIRPACLYQEYDAAPAQALATGWGITDIGEDRSELLLKARLDILDNVRCALQHNRSAAVPRGVVPSMICAGDVSGGWHSDTCQGDSGGPLQIIHPEITCLYQVVGITSFGKLCALRNSPGVYTRISHYLDWIEKIVWPAGK